MEELVPTQSWGRESKTWIKVLNSGMKPALRASCEVELSPYSMCLSQIHSMNPVVTQERCGQR